MTTMTWAEKAMVIQVPIEAPEGWTPEMDLQEYVDRFGETEDLKRDSIAIMLEYNRALDRTLTNGLVFFLQKSNGGPEEFVRALSIPEKISWMVELVRKHARDYPYLARFSNALWDCHLADQERCRILRACCCPDFRSDDPGFSYPIYQLADAIGAARIELDEALRYENKDYKEVVDEDDE